MSAFNFKIDGFGDIQAALQGIRKVPTRKAALKRAMVQAAQPMAELAQGMAPVRTGKLKLSIKVGTKLTRRQSALAIKQPNEMVLYIGPDGRVNGVTQEFGTVKHPPHPFMRPAWERDNRAMLARLSELLRKEVFATLGRQR